MPTISMNTLIAHIGSSNWHFEWFKSSSLAPILTLLGGNKKSSGDIRVIQLSDALKIEALIQKLPTDKLNKYKSALEYLGGALDIDSYAVPINPKMEFVKFQIDDALSIGKNGGVTLSPGRYLHVHKLTFQSSNGDLGVFNHTLTREHIWYPNQKPWDTPFSDVMSKVPLSFNQPENGSIGTSGFDDHSTILPEYIVRWPIQPGKVEIRQQYEYKVPNGKKWKPIPGAAFMLEKGVRTGKNGVDAFYFFKKNYYVTNHQAFHFEVEYDLGKEPADLPTKLPSAFKFPKDADMSKYGTVISTG